MPEGLINFMLYLTYALIGIGVLSAVLFPIYHLVENPHGAGRSLVGIAILIVIIGIAYGLAGDEVLPLYEKYAVDASISKKVGGGLIATYIFACAAILAAVYSEVSRLFK